MGQRGICWGTAGAAAAALLAVGAPSALAGAGAVELRSVLSAERIDYPVSSVLPDGRALVGWTNGNNNRDAVNVMVRPSGGVLGPKYTALRRGYSGEDFTFLPGGPADSPVLAYFNDGTTFGRARYRFDGSSFGSLALESNNPGRFPEYARCPNGTTVATYQATYSAPPAASTYAVVSSLADAYGEPTGSSFSGPSNRDTFQVPHVTCDRSDVPILSYAYDPDGRNVGVGSRLRISQLGPGGGVLLNRDLGPSLAASAPRTHVAPDGRIWALWTEYNTATTAAVSYVATRAPGATGPLTPSVIDAAGGGQDLFLGVGGTVHVLIAQDYEMGGATYAVRSAAAGGATFGPSAQLTTTKGYGNILLGHPDGAPRLQIGVFGPAPDYASTYTVRGIPAAGSNDPAHVVGVLSGTPSFSWFPTGDLLFLGARTVSSTESQLLEGGYDMGAPPTLDAVSVPGLAAPGEAVALTIDAKDPLGLSAFSWTVDGRTITDQDTSHTFAKPGSYVVTARAVDRAGNASEITRTVRVLDPAAVTPGSAAFDQAVKDARGARRSGQDRTRARPQRVTGEVRQGQDDGLRARDLERSGGG